MTLGFQRSNGPAFPRERPAPLSAGALAQAEAGHANAVPQNGTGSDVGRLDLVGTFASQPRFQRSGVPLGAPSPLSAEALAQAEAGHACSPTDHHS